MAIRDSALNGGISRNPSAWFDPTISWTSSAWYRYTGTLSSYVTLWMYGVNDYAGPYIWLGGGSAGFVTLETFDGVATTLDTTPTDLGFIWRYVTVRYTSGSHLLELLLAGTLVPGGAITVNLGATVPAQSIEYLLNDESGSSLDDLTEVTYQRRWQAALTDAQIRAEMVSATPVHTANLIANAQLLSTSDLSDTEGHSWIPSGTLANVTGPSFATTKQVVCVQQNFFEPGIGFPPAQRASGLWGAQQDVIQRIDGREELTVIPWATAATFRNLCVQTLTAPGADTWSFTLYKNQVATALTVSMTGATLIVTDTTHSVTVVPGDQIGMRGTTSNTPIVNWSWECESFTPKEVAYGGLVGVIGVTHTGTTGALGDGTSGANIGGSVNSAAGVMTTTRAKALTAPGGGETYTFTVLLNSVLQNGSGGTPDTRCIISDAALTAVSDYALPLAAGDIVGMRIVTSAGAPTSGNDIAFGVAITSTNAGEYSTVGAMDLPTGSPHYVWEGSASGTETSAACLIGISGLVLTGFRVYQSGPAPDSNTWTYALRQSGSNPANQPLVSLTGSHNVGSTTYGADSDVTHRVGLNFGDTVDLIITGPTAGNRVNWGFVVSTGGSIIVFKTTIPSTDLTTEFPFLAGGGLIPSSFSLTNGAWELFDNVPAGSGYSIEELVPTGWQMTASTNTGDPLDNLVVTNGQQVSVEVVNRLVFAPTFTVRLDPIRRQRVSPHLFALGQRVFISELQLDLEAGRGATTGQGSDPQVMLRLSRDGGHTWGDELWTSAGKIGEYSRRVIYRRLGFGRDWVAEVTVTDPISWSLVNCWVTLEEGLS